VRRGTRWNPAAAVAAASEDSCGHGASGLTKSRVTGLIPADVGQMWGQGLGGEEAEGRLPQVLVLASAMLRWRGE
jgi:hypothetical protein